MNEFRLGDLLRIRHGFAFRGEFFASNGDKIVLTPGHFRIGGGLQPRPGKEKYYSGDYPRRFELTQGSLLIALTDLTQNAPILGSPARIPRSNEFLHNQRLGLIEIIRDSDVSSAYLYYLFADDGVRSQIRATATGSTVRHTAPERVYAVRAKLPPIRVQRKIAAILSAYDDLIENNRRLIEILEESTRAIYREWFEISGRSQPRVTLALSNLVEEVRVAVSPSDVDDTVPYVGLEHIPRRQLTIQSWGSPSSVTSSKRRFRAGDVLFGKIRPNLHKVARAHFDGVASSDAIVLRAKDPALRAFCAAVLSSDSVVAHAVATSQGTKMPRANWDVLSRLEVSGNVQRAREFSRRIEPMHDAMASMARTNRALSLQRDVFLPKLISGELDVGGLDIDTSRIEEQEALWREATAAR